MTEVIKYLRSRLRAGAEPQNAFQGILRQFYIIVYKYDFDKRI